MSAKTQPQSEKSEHVHQVIDAIRADELSRNFTIEASFDEEGPSLVLLTENDPRPDRPKPDPVKAWFGFSSLAHGWLSFAPRHQLVVSADQTPEEIAHTIVMNALDLCSARDDPDHPDFPGIH